MHLWLVVVHLLLFTAAHHAMETPLEEEFELVASLEEEFELMKPEASTQIKQNYYPNASYFIVHGEQCEKWKCGTRTPLQKCREKNEHKLVDWTLLGDAKTQKIAITFHTRTNAKIKTDVIEASSKLEAILDAQQRLDPYFLPLAYSASIIKHPTNSKRSICFKDANGTPLCTLPYQGSTAVNDPRLQAFTDTIDLTQLKEIVNEIKKVGSSPPC